MSSPPKTVELEIRLARLELLIHDVKEAMWAISRRTVALQAQLDHLLAKIDQR